MAVAQLCKHVAQHFEELFAGHLLVHAYLIFLIDCVPVKSVLLLLVVKEAVVLVNYLPQCLEVSLPGVGQLVFIDAGGERNAKRNAK